MNSHDRLKQIMKANHTIDERFLPDLRTILQGGAHNDLEAVLQKLIVEENQVEVLQDEAKIQKWIDYILEYIQVPIIDSMNKNISVYKHNEQLKDDADKAMTILCDEFEALYEIIEELNTKRDEALSKTGVNAMHCFNAINLQNSKRIDAILYASENALYPQFKQQAFIKF